MATAQDCHISETGAESGSFLCLSGNVVLNVRIWREEAHAHPARDIEVCNRRGLAGDNTDLARACPSARSHNRQRHRRASRRASRLFRPALARGARAPSSPSTCRKSFLRAQLGEREASAPASPSRGPGNGILRADWRAILGAEQRKRWEFGSQTATDLSNRPELQGSLLTRKPRRFAGTAW